MKKSKAKKMYNKVQEFGLKSELLRQKIEYHNCKRDLKESKKAKK